MDRRLELSVDDSCLLWGSQVIVSSLGQEVKLKEIHEGHPGICRIKALGCMQLRVVAGYGYCN